MDALRARELRERSTAFENRVVRLEPLVARRTSTRWSRPRPRDRSTFELAPVPRDRAEMVDVRRSARWPTRRATARCRSRWCDASAADERGRLDPLHEPRVVELAGRARLPCRRRAAPRRRGRPARRRRDRPRLARAVGAAHGGVTRRACLLLMTPRLRGVARAPPGRSRPTRAIGARAPPSSGWAAHFEGILRAHLPAADGDRSRHGDVLDPARRVAGGTKAP